MGHKVVGWGLVYMLNLAVPVGLGQVRSQSHRHESVWRLNVAVPVMPGHVSKSWVQVGFRFQILQYH